jgi:hypothetical protein
MERNAAAPSRVCRALPTAMAWFAVVIGIPDLAFA